MISRISKIGGTPVHQVLNQYINYGSISYYENLGYKFSYTIEPKYQDGLPQDIRIITLTDQKGKIHYTSAKVDSMTEKFYPLY
jgi:hypothetical protein